MATYREIYKVLIQIRKDKGITQKDMAGYLGITGVTMYRYEGFKREIPGRMLIEYADYLGYELKPMIK
jgi:transcriptional regulator with XRE-family HTH domain